MKRIKRNGLFKKAIEPIVVVDAEGEVMQMQSILKFLICSTIPTVKDEKMRPDDVDANDWLWKCIYRAHRDVLTGRGNVEKYSCKNKNMDPKKKYNCIAYDLYGYLSSQKCQSKKKISSRECIIYLTDKYGEKLTGAIQKLVNMSMKYMYKFKEIH